MSFLPAISIIALLAMLPVLISLRASMVEGGTDFAAACAVAAATTLFLMLSEIPALRPLSLIGIVFLIGACLFVLSGFHRALGVLRPMSTPLVAAASISAVVVLIAAFGPHSATLHALSAVGIAAAFVLIIAVCSQHRRAAPGGPPEGGPAAGRAACALDEVPASQWHEGGVHDGCHRDRRRPFNWLPPPHL